MFLEDWHGCSKDPIGFQNYYFYICIFPYSTYDTFYFFTISKLNFDCCCCFDVFYDPTFLIHQMSIRISGLGGCYSKENIWVKIIFFFWEEVMKYFFQIVGLERTI